ncbi:MAG: nitrogenase molybdenum-iron cofactor biosynthesis protein NifB/NifX-related protein, iron-sulfur [Holophagaceae bacterium]|nr:nitrogenase molybdenum-iron cofactor biosynthesis protein NifB/NifX-related protein, iron-sulfur [Holophagaceae bacterium]
MKTAISTLTDRIAPVFDTANELLLVDCEHSRLIGKDRVSFDSREAGPRAVQLSTLGVQTLLCGAISTPFRLAVEGCGIRVIPFLTGKVEEILGAWICDGLDESRFSMPGCQGSCRNRGATKRGGEHKKRGRSCKGLCVCPVCGQEAAHTPGTPCKELLCPKCGTAMARQ